MGAITAVFAFAIAFIVYGAGPLYIATEWKKHVRKLRYWIFCVLYDAVVFIALQLITESGISPVNLAVTALLFGTIFYFIGLAILRKKDSTATPPAQAAAPQPPAEPEASASTQPSSPLPITETWYTCPSCGCLTHTGEVCSCGYHPPKVKPPKSPVKKQKWLIIAAAVLAVTLACSVFYNVEQRNQIAQAQTQLDAKQNTIENYSRTITSLQEYNMYLEEDLANLCPNLPISSDDSKFRHDIRHCDNPFLYSQGKEETEAYWMLMHVRRANGELPY